MKNQRRIKIDTNYMACHKSKMKSMDDSSSIVSRLARELSKSQQFRDDFDILTKGSYIKYSTNYDEWAFAVIRHLNVNIFKGMKVNVVWR